MTGKKLATIYSVGEGRTVVLASDGCRLCVGAFSILINSATLPPAEAPAHSSGEDDHDGPLRDRRSAKSEKSLLDTHTLPWARPPHSAADRHAQGGAPLSSSPGPAEGAPHPPLIRLSLAEEDEGGAGAGDGPGGASPPPAAAPEVPPGLDEEGRKELGGRRGQEGEGRKERGGRRGEEGEATKAAARSPIEELKRGLSPKGHSPKGHSPTGHSPRGHSPNGEARRAAPLRSPLAHPDEPRKAGASPRGAGAHKEEREKKAGEPREGKERKGEEHKEERGGGKRGDPEHMHKGGRDRRGAHTRPPPLSVYDPAKEEGEAPEQDLRLRSTDRLIVALYTHPSHMGLPAVPHVAVPDVEHRGLAAKARGFKSKPKDKESPRAGNDSLPRSHEDSSDAIPGLPPAHPRATTPKLGPGDTYILNPAEWEDVEASLEFWGCGKSRDSLAKMAQAARDKQIRFEAVQVEGLSEEGAEAEEGRASSKSLLPSAKKKSSELGHALVAFCEHVEASMLLLGVHHSHHAHELKSKSFVHNFATYCLDHCHCTVRAVSGQQVRLFVGEPAPPADSSFKSAHSVIDAIVTNYVRDC